MARLDVTPNLFEIHMPRQPLPKPKSPNVNEKSKKPPVLLTGYLSLPEGLLISEINPSSLRLNAQVISRQTVVHKLVLEAQFEVDEAFVASMLRIDIALIDKIQQDAKDIRVFLNAPIEIAAITLGQLQVTGTLNNQAIFASEDASRQIVLKEVAAPPIAMRTVLGQNFPNPGNPETWFPYELESSAEVTIFIFNVRGQLVRRLSLGYQKAGFYTRRNEAAYWDGRNATGERIASGVYFYTIQAGEYTATRKMLIVK
jgi:hypothetical protein